MDKDKLFDLIAKMYFDMNTKFDSMEKRLVLIEERFDSIEERFDSLERKVDENTNSIFALENKVESATKTLYDGYIQNAEDIKRIETKIEELSDKVDKHDIKIQVIEGGKKAL